MSPKSSSNAVAAPLQTHLVITPLAPVKVSKKATILDFARAHPEQVNVEAIAEATASRPSYVAAVLKEARLLPSYFDLYTSTAPMNIYSEQFRGKVGFRDLPTAKASVKLMEQLYEQFAASGDRAGQHHVLVEALQLFDRARWSHKNPEARVFRRFLRQRLALVDYAKLIRSTLFIARFIWAEAARRALRVSLDRFAHSNQSSKPGSPN